MLLPVVMTMTVGAQKSRQVFRIVTFYGPAWKGISDTAGFCVGTQRFAYVLQDTGYTCL